MSTMSSNDERRAHPRVPIAGSAEFFHGPTQRDFPARCVDISVGGMLMYVPAQTPVQPGHPVRVCVGGINRPEFAPLGQTPVDATVVRVDRQKLLREGQLAVGIRFAEA
jgi:hypothetical protein